MMTTTKRVVSAALAVLLFSVAAQAQSAGTASVLNPNTATEAELLTVPHLTPALVKALIAARPFKSILQLSLALNPALTDAQRKEVYVRLFVPINLNTATREEIMLVPGMGPRMAHEFEEYRPYTSIEQFRKEIGKYVNQGEVARFEKYVTLK